MRRASERAVCVSDSSCSGGQLSLVEGRRRWTGKPLPLACPWHPIRRRAGRRGGRARGWGSGSSPPWSPGAAPRPARRARKRARCFDEVRHARHGVDPLSSADLLRSRRIGIPRSHAPPRKVPEAWTRSVIISWPCMPAAAAAAAAGKKQKPQQQRAASSARRLEQALQQQPLVAGWLAGCWRPQPDGKQATLRSHSTDDASPHPLSSRPTRIRALRSRPTVVMHFSSSSSCQSSLPHAGRPRRCRLGLWACSHLNAADAGAGRSGCSSGNGAAGLVAMTMVVFGHGSGE